MTPESNEKHMDKPDTPCTGFTKESSIGQHQIPKQKPARPAPPPDTKPKEG